jgi:murein DD-endopeptidase MepM/ murein hydrolase activator NlpD
MSVNLANDIIERMRVAAQGGDQAGGKPDSEKLKQLAAQFESMLMTQMLRGMRESGKWDEDDEESMGLGADAFFDTIDVELANRLATAKGLGLSGQLLQAFEKLSPKTDAATPRRQDAKTDIAVTPLEEPHTPAQVGGAVRFELAPGSVTSDFGWRRDPFTGRSKFHRGIDIKAAYGEEIQAAGDGRVVFSGEQKGYGTTIVLEHANGVRTRYAHLSAAVVQEGDQVGAGQVLGRAGKSGRATGTHLHFEVVADGKHVDPAQFGLIPPARTDE